MANTNANKSTIGQYLGQRLFEIGISDYFAIPGDFNLTLLDELLKVKQLQMINCCNELNAGYAADGYARAKGAAAVVVTFSAGGLSTVNAAAGAYAEDLPVIFISGGPNANSMANYQILHHTTAKHDYEYVHNIFREVTAAALRIDHPENAAQIIDKAIKIALTKKKPVYIEIACNIADYPISKPYPIKLHMTETSDPKTLKEAVKHAAKKLNQAVKPILVAGVRLRPWHALSAFEKLADKSEYAVAAMPNAKSFFPENHKNFIGVYWGPVSTPGCSEIVESSDCYLFAGPLFSDYTTTGYSTLIHAHKMIIAGPDFVKVDGNTYDHVFLAEFLTALTKAIKKNNKSILAYNRIRGEAPTPPAKHPLEAIVVRRLFSAINEMLTKKNALIVETGDSWFNSIKLKLPQGCNFEIQMQYGSIGWSVGATLGYAVATKGKKRVIATIGDGSFQMTAQEISTMIRYNLNPIIFLINNGGYTIEVEIHDGPYNVIKNWNYAELIKVFNAKDGKAWSATVRTQKELDQAIKKALKLNVLCFIEVMIDRNDCSKLLLEWGSRVASNNGKALHPTPESFMG